MKYRAVIETDDYKDFEFYEDGNGKYIHGIDAGSVNGEWIPLYFIEYMQDSIIDKIQVEIEESRWIDKDTRIERNALASGLDKALEIIDKYKVES